MSDVDGNALDPSNISKQFIIIFFRMFSYYGIVSEQSLKGERLLAFNSFVVLYLSFI